MWICVHFSDSNGSIECPAGYSESVAYMHANELCLRIVEGNGTKWISGASLINESSKYSGGCVEVNLSTNFNFLKAQLLLFNLFLKFISRNLISDKVKVKTVKLYRG